MSKKFVNLNHEPSNITEVMAGPWRDIRIETLGEGDSIAFVSDTVEHSCFLLEGHGALVNNDGQTFPIEKGSAFALPAGGKAQVNAQSDVRILHIEMNLPK